MAKKKRNAKPAKDAGQTDVGLWDRVKTTVDPLSADQRLRYSQALAELVDEPVRTRTNRPAEPAHGAIAHHAKGHKAYAHTPPPAEKPKKLKINGAPQPPLVDLDRKTKSRIARGRTPIDSRIDLHGMRQHEAQDALRAFIWRAHARGDRTVLVVTGKGSRQAKPHPDAPPWAVGSGILRRAVPQWLASADMRSAVLGVEPAHISHGGEGALYVRLRAKKA
ncbi:MAG: Smr/MutS family protein [Cohaesibacteraceae bacterium]